MVNPVKGLSGRQFCIIVVVLSIYFFAPTQAIISSVLGDIGAAYPDVSADWLTYLISINNVAAVVSAAFFGVLAGHKMRFRTISIIAMLCFVIGGALPAVLPLGTPFWILLVTRVVIGIGRGCFVPMVQIILCGMFKDEKTRSDWFGIGNITFNLGATFGTVLAGYLGLIDWRLCFLFYAFAFIPLALFMFFFHEEDSGIEKNEAGSTFHAVKFEWDVWAHMVLYLLAIVMTQTLWNYASTSMTVRGIGSDQVGLILSTFTVASMVIGLTIGIIFRATRSFIMALGIGVITIGFAVMMFAMGMSDNAVPVMFASSALIGMGGCIVTIGCPLSMSLRVSPAAVAGVLSMNEVFHNLGSFVASPYSQLVFALTGSSDPDTIWGATVVFGIAVTVIAVAIGFAVRARGNKTEETSSVTQVSSAS